MASLTGFGFGGVLGGFAVGSAIDLVAPAVGTLPAYFVGGILGAFAGLVVSRIAASVLLS